MAERFQKPCFIFGAIALNSTGIGPALNCMAISWIAAAVVVACMATYVVAVVRDRVCG